MRCEGVEAENRMDLKMAATKVARQAGIGEEEMTVDQMGLFYIKVEGVFISETVAASNTRWRLLQRMMRRQLP